MLDQLRSLAVFARVVELGSFRAAARALGLSPSVVSHHVRTLEEHLALPLLHRSTRRLSLTPDGQRLFESAHRMVAAAEQGLDELQGQSTTLTGALRLTMPAFMAETSFAQDLAQFSADHPRVQLHLGFGEEPRDLLKDGLDLAIRIARLDDTSHKTRKLGEMRRVLVGSPRYVQSKKPPREPADLATWSLVRLRSRPAAVSLHRAGRRSVTLPLEPRLTVDGIGAVRALVLADAGICTMPEVSVRADLANGRLVRVLPQWESESVPVHALWPASAQRPALTMRFLDVLGPRISALFAA